MSDVYVNSKKTDKRVNVKKENEKKDVPSYSKVNLAMNVEKEKSK